MVPLYPPPFTFSSSLGYVFDVPESIHSHNQQNQEEIITTLDHFYLTTSDTNPHPQQQDLPSNMNHYYNYYNDVQLNNNIRSYNSEIEIFPPGLDGGNLMLLPPQGGPGIYTGTMVGPEDAMEVEKKRRLDHNASERDRRKKINSLYSSLRSVLPIDDKKKKLSNPSTVAWALKYIPELQKNVQLLFQRKHHLLSSTNNTLSSIDKSYYSVQATQLENGEIIIQISTFKSVDNATSIIPISEILRELEEDNGVVVFEVSSSESSAGRVFHNLHVMVEASQEVECESLREKLLCLCQKWEKFKAPAAMDELKSYDLQTFLYI